MPRRSEKESVIGRSMLSIISKGVAADQLTTAREDLNVWMHKDPMNFIRAKDPETGKHIITTQDERDARNPFKPVPYHKPYVGLYVGRLFSERLLVVEKSRQMMATTLTCLGILYETTSIGGRRSIISKVTEDEAKTILRDKIRGPWERAPQWWRELNPLTDKPGDRAFCKKQRSMIVAAAMNMANREARGNTASWIFVDEAAFQDAVRAIVDAVMPMAARLTLVTTPDISTIGGRFVRAVIYDEDLS